MLKKLILCFSMLFLSLSAHAVNYNDDVNCMGAYGMEDTGNETDLSGEGNTLTETSGTIPRDTGDFKTGVSSRDFESGDSEHLDGGDNTTLDINGVDQPISIVAFIKQETSSGNDYIVSKADTNASDKSHALLSDDGVIEFFISYNGLNATTAVGATDSPSGTWIHVAGVYNDTDIRVYLDGSLDSNGGNNPNTENRGINDGTDLFMIGARDSSGSGSEHFDGLIDDVGVFNDELTSIEVTDIFTNGMDGEGVIGVDVTVEPSVLPITVAELAPTIVLPPAVTSFQGMTLQGATIYGG